MTEHVTPEAFLKQAREIFEEREREFQMREMAFERKNETLKRMLEEASTDRKSLEKKKEDLKAIHERAQAVEKNIKEKEQELNKRESMILAEESRLQKKEKELFEKESEISMKYNLSLERVRNEEMKLKRIREDFEYKLSLLDDGQIRELIESEKKCEIYDLEDAIENDVESGSAEKDHSTVPEVKKEAKSSIKGGGTEVVEELTAEVLKKYMEKNESAFQDIAIKHSEKGDILCAKSGSLEYVFTFSNPLCFEVAAVRKNDARLRKRLREFNKQYADIQFTYDRNEKKAIAAQYFENTLLPDELMKKVKDVSGYFSPNR